MIFQLTSGPEDNTAKVYMRNKLDILYLVVLIMFELMISKGNFNRFPRHVNSDVSLFALLYESSSGNQVDGLPLVSNNTGVVVRESEKEQRFFYEKYILK